MPDRRYWQMKTSARAKTRIAFAVGLLIVGIAFFTAFALYRDYAPVMRSDFFLCSVQNYVPPAQGLFYSTVRPINGVDSGIVYTNVRSVTSATGSICFNIGNMLNDTVWAKFPPRLIYIITLPLVVLFVSGVIAMVLSIIMLLWPPVKKHALGTAAIFLLIPLEIEFTITSGLFGRFFFAAFQYTMEIAGIVHETQSVLDLWMLVLSFVIMALLLLDFHRKGAKGLFSALSIMSLSLLPLPVEIFMFDRSAWNLYFVSLLRGTSLAWFSNAVLCYCLIITLAASLSVLALLRLSRRNLPKSPD